MCLCISVQDTLRHVIRHFPEQEQSQVQIHKLLSWSLTGTHERTGHKMLEGACGGMQLAGLPAWAGLWGGSQAGLGGQSGSFPENALGLAARAAGPYYSSKSLCLLQGSRSLCVASSCSPYPAAGDCRRGSPKGNDLGSETSWPPSAFC